MAQWKPNRRTLLWAAFSGSGLLLAWLTRRPSVSGGARSNVPPGQKATPIQNATPQPSPAIAHTHPEPEANTTTDTISLPMPERTLGRSGLTVPVLGLGGSASPLSRPGAEAEAIAIIERSVELGIRYFDAAANYGPCEERLGKVLPAYRDQVIIASKTSKRDRDSAWRQLETSLKRLNTDYLDLWQFHALTHAWDIDTILDRQSGAILAAEEAREQGIIRSLGITGHHNPDIIVNALQQYEFDTALVPINAADIHTPAPFISNVLPIAQQKGVGVIAMKVPAYGRLFAPGLLTGMDEAMGYALSQPGVHCSIIAAETLEQLNENVQVAQRFQPLPAATLTAMEHRTASAWQRSSFFRAWG